VLEVALCSWGTGSSPSLCGYASGDRLCCVRDLANVALGTGSLVSVAGSTGDMLVLLRDASERQWGQASQYQEQSGSVIAKFW
jgi:hypothetical protein